MRARILAVLTVFSLLFTGCAKGGAGENPSSEADGRSSSRFIFVCPILENEYWEACMRGIRRADAELGTVTEVIGPQTADNFAVEIVDYMKQAVAARPDGIMAYAGIEDLFPLIDQATKEGIPVLAVDSDAPDTSRIAYLGTDLYEFGCKAGETLVSLTGGSAKIGYLYSSRSAQNEAEVYQAFQDAVYDYDMEVVTEAEGRGEADYAAQAVEAMLQEHPEITAIFCTSSYNITGAARAKEALGREDLVLLGLDDVEENLAFVRKGVINALLAQSPEQMGYKSVYLMKEYKDKGSLPSDTYHTATLLIHPDNVDSYSTMDLAAEGAGKTVRVGYYTGDSSFQDGFTEGARKSGYAYEYYMAIAALTGWKYEYIYGSRAESMKRLASGEVDIVAGVHQTDLWAGHVLFSKYDMGMNGDSRYFAVTASRSDLLVDLNYAMEQIQNDTPHFSLDLHQRYYHQVNEQQVLTTWETEWLSRAGSLRIGYVRHNLPLSDQGEDGEPAGLIHDLLDIFSDYLHVEIQPICYENVFLLEEGLRQREIDAAFPIYSDLWLNESKGFVQTDSFINDRVMLVYQGSYQADLMDSVGLSNTGIGQRYYLAEYYPEAQIHYYDSREEIFQAIRNGEVKCIAGCSSILQRFLAENKQYKDMNIAYFDTSENFSIAVNQGESTLVSILNKAIRQTGSAAITNSIIHHSSVTAEYTIQDILQKYSITLIAILSGFFAILLLVFYSYRKRVTAFNAEQAKTQARLEEALREAEIASEAKTTFLSSMSHDIRTPMNAIVGMTTIATKHMDDPARVEDCLKKINLSSHHLLTLINDVLDISKIESGRLTLNPVNCSLRDMFTSLISIIRPQVQAKNLQFDVHIHGVEHEIIHADEVRLNQIFINILTNAVKYTPDGGKVVMDLAQEPIPGEERVRLVYTVADTGIGMSKEFMANMYNTFSRAKDTRIDKIQGTGLGLAIVRQMVDLMDGTIDCKSQEGVGTTFIVTIEAPVVNLGAEQPTLPGLRVLLVDDDRIFLESTSDTLSEMGAVPETACGGEAARNMVQAKHEAGEAYDLIIVDWKMPGMNGIETVEAIRNTEGGRVPTLLVSAYDWSDIEEEAKDCGFSGFINKPMFRSCIYETVCEAIRSKEPPADRGELLANTFKGMHLLVAEDNDLNWEVISELLEMYDITTEHAENGEICFEMLSRAPEGTYDMVLMDVQMPVMNGKEAAKAIRASSLPHVRNIPIIAMTADAFAEDIAECMQADMDEHVAKPVDIDKLFQAMHKVLERRESSVSKI